MNQITNSGQEIKQVTKIVKDINTKHHYNPQTPNKIIYNRNQQKLK
jgi:hypothetical protein